MRKYRTDAATPLRLDYGVELAAGLTLFPETAPFAAPFIALNTELETAYEDRLHKRKPLAIARVALRHENYRTDQLLRSAARAAEIADGGRRGPIFEATFPDGLRPVVTPEGARQIAPTRDLIDRLGKSRVAGIDAYRKEWLPKLATALASLEKAAALLDAATRAHRDAFTTELALRDQHLVAVDALMGQVKAVFPRDKDRQDLVFPIVEEGNASAPEPSPAEPPSPQPG
jgi:hypothetical protein